MITSSNAQKLITKFKKKKTRGFTKSLCKETGRKNIRVNCIAPGLTSTDMTAGNKMLTFFLFNGS